MEFNLALKDCEDCIRLDPKFSKFVRSKAKERSVRLPDSLTRDDIDTTLFASNSSFKI